MAILHDSTVRASLETRLHALKPDTKPRWGKMSVDQMLWHVNQALAEAVGEIKTPAITSPVPRPVMRFAVLNLPWVKNAPTNPSFVAKAKHDFNAEKARCLQLIARLTGARMEDAATVHPMFGTMTGRQVSQLHAKHLNHHFSQFGV